jgi:hypothetical protein
MHKNTLLNTISSNGFVKATDQLKTMAIVGKARLNATIGSSMFKDQTGREDFKHYIPNHSNNPNALKNIGPGAYFKDKQPFLKRSYNASLPSSKFY